MIIKSPVFWIVTIFVVIALIAVLGFYQGVTISVAVLSVIISITSTFFASRSLKLANESLKLTRDKVRPFLFIQPGDIKIIITPEMVSMAFGVKNTGSLPGELVKIDATFFSDNELVTNDNESKEFPILFEIPTQPILFPDSIYTLSHSINISFEDGKKRWEAIKNGKITIRHRINYKDKHNVYVTIQTEKLFKVYQNTFRRTPISPQYWT